MINGYCKINHSMFKLLKSNKINNGIPIYCIQFELLVDFSLKFRTGIFSFYFRLYTFEFVNFLINRSQQTSLRKFPPFCCPFPSKESNSLMPNPRRSSVTTRLGTFSVPVRMPTAWISLLTLHGTTKQPNIIVMCSAVELQ